MERHVILMKALGDLTLLKILKLIWDRERCVCELYPVLGISQPAVSQHIAKLKAAGLVRERRAGMWVYYQADRERLLEGLKAFRAFLDADLTTIPELCGVDGRGCC